jgi:hypothetical protein
MTYQDLAPAASTHKHRMWPLQQSKIATLSMGKGKKDKSGRSPMKLVKFHKPFSLS